MKRIYAVRILLGVLILLNLWMIYSFSAESSAESGKTSATVIRPVAQVVVKDFTSKPQTEQDSIISSMQLPVRKLAHMAEFGTLAALVLLFIRTWRLSLPICFGGAMLSSAAVAAFDELHQHLADAGRAGKWTDVLIDLGGALFACSILTLILVWIGHSKKRKQAPL